MPARRLTALVLFGALGLGIAAAVHYARLDLTLSHYDARAHLVVARRITDSLTPGWRQIGGVWLPLPHLINMVPVQWDWAYRTGLPSTMISIAALAAGLASIARFLFERSGSIAAALVAPALILLNPNILYLQSTPMTEPLLLGLALLAVTAVDRWTRDRTVLSRRFAGWMLVALTLTRYEGWCVAGALVALGALRLRRDGRRAALALVPYYVLAIVAFLCLSKGTTGQWFLDSGFFVPDNPAQGRPLLAAGEIAAGVARLGGVALVAAAIAGVIACLTATRLALTMPLALLTAGALPWVAFLEGHPFRVRYMVPLVAASAVMSAIAIAALPRRWRALAAVVLVAVVLRERPPLDAGAAMVTEAQWETPFRIEREAVTAYLRETHDGTPILASMGSLGHYMQEASRAGFNLADFVHEGTGDLWKHALRAPGAYVHWVLIEERAEGGDMLFARTRENPALLAGFSRVVHGGGLSLYHKP